MLVLSRKVGERIQIGDEIQITVVRVTSTGVRLGVETAPGAVVVRAELQDPNRHPPGVDPAKNVEHGSNG